MKIRNFLAENSQNKFKSATEECDTTRNKMYSNINFKLKAALHSTYIHTVKKNKVHYKNLFS